MTVVANSIVEFYDRIQRAADRCQQERSALASQEFFPDLRPPPLDERWERFYAASEIKLIDLGDFGNSHLTLLDLTCNPGTRTTKTFASHLIVARAVQHIRATGESMLLLTPTSANKGGAIRNAVWRAIECGLVDSGQLRIAIVAPARGRTKLWSSPLSEEPTLRAINPVFLVETADGRDVKALTRSFVSEYSASLRDRFALRVWHTYDIDNYRVADAVRAFVENAYLEEPRQTRVRVHAQAVSSAFGLLGHHYGWRLLSDAAALPHQSDLRWLLVQHLGTPDLVLHHLYGSFSRENMPDFKLEASSGLWTQSESRCFPRKTFATDEVIDETFYSHEPATAARVKKALMRDGSAGIVVSLAECLERYAFLRTLLAGKGGPEFPGDPRDLREWALVMVMTGAVEALERGMFPEGSDIVVHATGSYSVHDFEEIPREHTHTIREAGDLYRVICQHGGPA